LGGMREKKIKDKRKIENKKKGDEQTQCEEE
jgi:hypothetical protein